MTQFIEPNKKSDLVAPRVFDWLKCLRTGLLEGFTVTPGSSGLLITIASGRVVIGGTTIYDDLTCNDATLISSAPGTGNRHFLVYAKYTYVDTFPPAAMEIRVVMNSAVAPLKPTAPALPVNGVKLADIFLPEGDTDWTDALFVNAPKMPDRGQANGDVLIERLIASNANVICAGGGSIIYDGGGNITWTQDIKFFALTTTHQEKYFSVPLAVGQILVGASPLTGVTDNCIVFTVLDRTAVGDPAAPGNLPLYVLDINAPGSGAWDIFFDPANRDDIFWLAMVIDGELVTRAGVGNSLPSPDVSDQKFLRNDPGGDHLWSLLDGGVVKDSYVDGGLHSYEWNSGTYATVYLALDALVAAGLRKEGMIVRMSRASDHVFVDYTWLDSAWKPLIDTVTAYGYGIVTGFAVATGGGGTWIGVGKGVLVGWDGKARVMGNDATSLVPSGPGTWIVGYNTLTDAIVFSSHAGGAGLAVIPLAVVTHNGAIFTGLEECQLRANGGGCRTSVTVGSTVGLYGANFTTIRKALVWMACFPPSVETPREVIVTSDITEPPQAHINGCISFDSDPGSGEYDPYLATAGDMDGLRIVGRADGAVSPESYPTVTFGSTGIPSYFLNPAFACDNIHIKDLRFVYDGSTDDLNYHICAFLNLGRGARVYDCAFPSASSKLTLIAEWETVAADANLGGGDAVGDGNGTVFERIYVDSAVGYDCALFGMSVDGTLYGKISIIDCNFTAASSLRYGYALVAYDLASDINFVVDICNTRFSDCNTTVVDVDQYARVMISNSIFGFSDVSYRDIECNNGEDAQVSNCAYTPLASMTLGADLYTGCIFSGPLVIDETHTHFANCICYQKPFGHVSGLAIASRFDGTQRSQVLYGCELGPYADNNGASWYPGGAIKSGVTLFPNGTVGKLTTEASYSLFVPSTGARRQNIAGSATWTVPDGSDEFSFYFFLRMKLNDSTPVLRFDTSPPDVYGRPQAVGGAEATAGYTVNDYAFVGTLEVFEDMQTSSSKVEAIPKLFKGGSYVQHLGDGTRKFGGAVTHSTSGNLTGGGGPAVVGSGVSIAYVVWNATYWDGRSQFTQAMGLGWTLSFEITETGGVNPATVAIVAGNFSHLEAIPASGSVSRSFNIESPLCGVGQDNKLIVTNNGTGVVNFTWRWTLHTFVENVNRPLVRQNGVVIP